MSVCHQNLVCEVLIDADLLYNVISNIGASDDLIVHVGNIENADRLFAYMSNANIGFTVVREFRNSYGDIQLPFNKSANSLRDFLLHLTESQAEVTVIYFPIDCSSRDSAYMDSLNPQFTAVHNHFSDIVLTWVMNENSLSFDYDSSKYDKTFLRKVVQQAGQS